MYELHELYYMNYTSIRGSVSMHLSPMSAVAGECAVCPHRKNQFTQHIHLNFPASVRIISLSVNLRKNLSALVPVITVMTIIKLHF